jgi:hypothetical protein
MTATVKQFDESSENVWYTPKSLAAHLQVSTDTVMGWIWSGQLRAMNVARKIGGRPRWRVDPKAFQEFMLARQSQASITRDSKPQFRPYRPPRPVAGVNRRLAENIPHEVRVKKSALAMANRKGGQYTEWRPFVPLAIERYERKHGVCVKEEDVVVLKAWWEEL